MECRVLAWQNAADLTQPHLTEANAGPKKGNPDGHQQTVYPRFWHQRVPKFRILRNILIHQNDETILKRKSTGFDSPKALITSVGFFIGQFFLYILCYKYVSWHSNLYI